MSGLDIISLHFLTMPETKRERILQLLKETGVLRPRDLEEIGISGVYLNKLYAEGLLERPSRGLYTLADSEPSEHRRAGTASPAYPCRPSRFWPVRSSCWFSRSRRGVSSSRLGGTRGLPFSGFGSCGCTVTCLGFFFAFSFMSPRISNSRASRGRDSHCQGASAGRAFGQIGETSLPWPLPLRSLGHEPQPW